MVKKRGILDRGVVFLRTTWIEVPQSFLTSDYILFCNHNVTII